MKAVPDPDDIDVQCWMGVGLLNDQEGSLNILLSATADVVDDIVQDLMVSRDEVQQLREAMETRAPIEQARGMLMMRYGLSAEKALRLLLRWSRSQRVELRVLAVTLVDLGVNEGLGNSHQQVPPRPARAEQPVPRSSRPAS